MNKQKIAILTDSCCDVPKHLAQQYQIYILPLKIIYEDREFIDGVNITPQEVYDGMKQEIPKTSLPDGESVLAIFNEIKQAGYEKVIAVTLSSGLSGTNNMIHLVSSTFEGLQFFILDTKNIAIGAGFHAIQAARYIEAGLSFEAIQKQLLKDVPNSKIFFVVETLEYLQKGGRIGLVASLFGNALNLKPVISCNEEGIYYTMAKVRGRKQSINRTLDLACAYAKGHKRINIAVVHGDAEAIAQECSVYMKEQFPDHEVFVSSQISPSLGVHTGPGAMAVAIEILE